jgi:Heparinase II/III-like protein
MTLLAPASSPTDRRAFGPDTACGVDKYAQENLPINLHPLALSELGKALTMARGSDSLGPRRRHLKAPVADTSILERATSPVLELLHGRCEGLACDDARHERVITQIDACYWLVNDWLRSPVPQDVTLNFQLSPAAQGATRLDFAAQEARLDSPGLYIIQSLRTGHHVSIEPGWIPAPSGRVVHAAPRWCTRARGANLDFDTVLVTDESVQIFTRTEAVAGDEGDIASMLEIHAHGPKGHCTDLWFHARDSRSTRWNLRGMHFEGRWVHARFQANGVLKRVVTHTGARLHGALLESPMVVVQPD